MISKIVLNFLILIVLSVAVSASGVAWAVEKQDLSSATTKTKQLASEDAVKSQALKIVPEKMTAVEARTMNDILPPGFRDDDDDSSLPYLLTPMQLRKFGIEPGVQEIKKLDRAIMRQRERLSPVLKVRIQAIITANSDGSDAGTITPEQISLLVDQANRVWWSSGIEFLFDPAKDVKRMNNTLLHLRNPLEEFEQNKTNPNWDPDQIDASPGHNARNYVGYETRGKAVVFFAKSFGFKWDETSNEWFMKSAGGFSGHDLEYVFMPNGMPEKNLLAHELGHYLHLPHPFVSEIGDDPILTVADAAKAIKDWVQNQGHAPKQGPLVFDGDNRVRYPGSVVDIKDTPPDPDGQIFNNTFGAGAKCMEAHDMVEVPVAYDNGKEVTYELKPDRLNIMSYYKGCHNLGTHGVSDGQIAAARNALINGNRMHLLTPAIERRDIMRKKAVN
jgi:hypothetical protein